jgi:hypothetical protein
METEFQISMWNFNMADLWQNMFGNMFKTTAKKSGVKDSLKAIWDELNV